MNGPHRRWTLHVVVCAAIGGCGDQRDEDANAPVGAPAVDVQTPTARMDDAEYLYRLGLMRGHLLVGHALFDLGERSAAGTHSKHPTDELYAPMEREFAARGTPGFAAQLQAHADAVAEADEDTVAERYVELVAAIAKNESVVDVSPELAAEVIVRLVREAAEEYAIGIVDGKPANAHEYQDAYGFTKIAELWAGRVADAASVFDDIREELNGLSGMWPSLIPPPELPHRAARIYGVAADIEILALEILR